MTYFDARELSSPEPSYVAWLDVMGIESHMHRSIKVAANFVYKFHAAALEAPRDGIALYPMMDGLYATSPTREALEAFLSSTFTELARMFMEEPKIHFRFLAKGSVTYGDVFHGCRLTTEASRTLATNVSHRDSIVLGIPVVEANRAERLAPPMGIAIHESALVAAPGSEPPFAGEWWHWFDSAYPRENLRRALRQYYAWCRDNVDTTRYERSRIIVHEALALRYLDDAF